MSDPSRGDPLLPLIRALDALWSDHLHAVLSGDAPFNRGGAMMKPEALADAFDRVYKATLVLSDKPPVGLADDPGDPDALQHRIRGPLFALYRFLGEHAFFKDNVWTEFKGFDAREQWRRREEFFRIRDLAVSVRFGGSEGRTATGTSDGRPARVILGEFEDRPRVDGKPVKRLNFATYKVVAALLAAKKDDIERLPGPELAKRSGVQDATRYLTRLAKEKAWKPVILLPNGVKGRGYGIR